MIGLYLGIGFGLLCIGLAVFRLIVTVRGPREHAGRTEPYSHLFSKFRRGPSEDRDMRSSQP